MSTVTNNNAAASLTDVDEEACEEETWKYDSWIGADVNESKDKINYFDVIRLVGNETASA